MAMASRLSALLYLTSVFSFVTARKGHMAPLGQSGIITPLPQEIQGFPDPVYFLKEHVLKNKPLVMRAAALDMPATKLWSDEYMRRKTAGDTQPVSIERGKKETRQSGLTMTFEEYLNKYNDSDIYYVNSVPKALNDDFIVPRPLQCKEYERSYEDNVMWFSSGGTKSVIHHDGYENINCLLRGQKRFLFVNTTKYKDIEKKIIDVEEGSYGTVDVERVDLDKYPFYEGMEFFSVDMKPGDCVYSPALWIHQVQSWGSNLAVNVWWFADINGLVKEENCNKEYNRSMTFKTIKFHKTTEISDGRNGEVVVHAIRHSISRFVFTETKSPSIGYKTFAKTMVGNKTMKADHIHSLFTIFRILDTNRNKKLEVSDLQVELSERKQDQLLQRGAEWLSEARLRDFPVLVDFSNDSYKTIKPFLWSEVTGEKADENTEEDREGEEEEMEKDDREKAPKKDPEVRTTISEHEEL